MSTFAWVFPVIDRTGRLATARVTVNAADLIVITCPDGARFGVAAGDQFDQLSAALRQARELAIRQQERRPPGTPHREHRRQPRNG